jgi:hypothetical protein
MGVHPIKKVINPKWKDPNAKLMGAKGKKGAGVEKNDNEVNNNEPKFIFKSCHTVKFPDINTDPRRVFEDWESYKNPPAGYENSKIMVHRIGPTPLDKILEANPINDVPLEEMHLMDIGVLKDTVACLLNLKVTDKTTSDAVQAPVRRRRKNAPVEGSKKKKLTKITPKNFIHWNTRINAWSKITPKEFGRHLDSLEFFGKWKATGHRVFFNYYMPALMYADPANFGEQKRDAVLHIIRGYKLLTGNTHKPVPPGDIVRAEKHLAKGFEIMKSLSSGNWCTYKCHCMSHLGDDVRYFGSRLGSFSAYPYENQMIFFRQIGLQGNRAIQQIANRLVENGGQLNDDELTGDSNTSNYTDESFESFFGKVMRNKASRPNMTVSDVLDLPPFFVHSFNESNKIIHCESFTITKKFPDNIVRLYFENTNHRKKNAFCIEEIIKDEKGQLFIVVREFANIDNSFVKPYASSSIGNFLAWGGLNPPQTVPFSRVIGKYFSFPQLLKIRDQKKKYNPRCPGQNWILQEIAHGDC